MSESSLTVGEKSKLETLELTISRGVHAFMEVGQALAVIRDERLYTDTADTFEDYCQEKWGFTRQRAHQYIEAAKVVETVSTIVDTAPKNEAQARALASVPNKKDQKRVWKKAVETAPKNGDGEPVVTAAHVAAVADEMEVIPPPEKKPKQVKNGRLSVDGRDFDKLKKMMEPVLRYIDDLGAKYPHANLKREAETAAKRIMQISREWQGAIR